MDPVDKGEAELAGKPQGPTRVLARPVTSITKKTIRLAREEATFLKGQLLPVLETLTLSP